LIPKKDNPLSFEEYMLISLCTSIYNIIKKLTTLRMKHILSIVVSKEQFGILDERHIHDVVSIAQETLHSINPTILIPLL